MTDPYLDALEQLDQMRDRAFKAEAAIARVRELCDESDQNRPRIDGYLINRTVPVKDIRRALDGDA